MLQLLRPNYSNLPCLYSTFHLEYPLVLSRFCLNTSWYFLDLLLSCILLFTKICLRLLPSSSTLRKYLIHFFWFILTLFSYCFFITDHSFSNYLTKRSFSTHIFEDLSCKSYNIVNVIECTLCGLIYVWETKEELRKRMKSLRCQINNRSNHLLYRHFYLHDHSVLSMKFRILGKIYPPTNRSN